MEILAVECPAVEMGDLTVGGYEDGGALPLCDVAHSQTYQNNRHLVVSGNYARSSWVFDVTKMAGLCPYVM
jgi:hypothetical protein